MATGGLGEESDRARDSGFDADPGEIGITWEEPGLPVRARLLGKLGAVADQAAPNRVSTRLVAVLASLDEEFRERFPIVQIDKGLAGPRVDEHG